MIEYQHKQNKETAMPYVRKDPAQVRLARQAAAAKSAEVRRKKAQETTKARRTTIEVFADDAEELAQMAAKVHKPRIQFVKGVVQYIREQWPTEEQAQ